MWMGIEGDCSHDGLVPCRAGAPNEHVEHCEQLLRQWTTEALDPPTLRTGDDLIQAGYRPGPIFKKLLDAVREAQLDGTIRTKEEACGLVKRLLAEWGESESPV